MPEHTVFSRVKLISEIKGFLLLGAGCFTGTATQNGTQDEYSSYYTLVAFIFSNRQFPGFYFKQFMYDLYFKVTDELVGDHIS